MYNGIALLSFLVSIMIHPAIECVRKNTKVADAKRFKKEAEGFQIIYQVIRANTQSGCGNGRVI